MLEIEIKSHCSDHEEIEKKLADIGAVFKERVEEEDIYFQHPCRDFRFSGEAFRIRKINERFLLTYKGPRISEKTKTRLEMETGIGNGKDASEIFTKLGFTVAGTVKKIRKIYSYLDMEICLDDVSGLGFFVEIEKIGTDAASEEKKLFDTAERLGLSEFTVKSYLDMILEEGE